MGYGPEEEGVEIVTEWDKLTRYGMRRSAFALLAALAWFVSGCGAPPPAPGNQKPIASAAAQSSRLTQLGSSSTNGAETLNPFPVSVTRTIDGDTIEVEWDGKVEKVRLIGVDTPELSHPSLGIKEQPYGREAAEYTRKVLMKESSRKVLLEVGVQERDKYGRLLAYVWLSYPKKGDEAEVREKMFNARLLLDGYAQIMTIPPNVKYADLFRKFQAEAREAGRGLWGLPADQSAPVPEQAAPLPSASGKGNCDPSYPDVCIPPPPPDLDCKDIPHRRFRVLPPDPHRFDTDRDGVGCER